MNKLFEFRSIGWSNKRRWHWDPGVPLLVSFCSTYKTLLSSDRDWILFRDLSTRPSSHLRNGNCAESLQLIATAGQVQ